METVSVTGLACPCEGTPHPEGDSVELRKRLDLAGGARLQYLVIQANENKADNAILQGQLMEAYCLVGVVGWTFVEPNGKPVILNDANIRRLLLSDFAVGGPVADKADELYLQPVLGPLLMRVANSSPTTTTAGSTSPTGNGSGGRPKRSKRSSTSTSQTDVTATTSS